MTKRNAIELAVQLAEATAEMFFVVDDPSAAGINGGDHYVVSPDYEIGVYYPSDCIVWASE